MSFVVSRGQLSVTGAGVAPTFAAVPLRSAAPWEYGEIWRRQPQVRTVVGFLARNVAQLGLHFFRRVSDTDRVRLTDHPAAVLMADPLPGLTTYRLVERIVSDLAIYDEFYAIKLDVEGQGRRLLPVPPTLIRPYGGNWAAPTGYEAASGQRFSTDQVVHIHGYTPDDLTSGSSPIEALRSILLEESESSTQRAQMWRGGARMTGVLSRPADAPEWSPEEKRRFRVMWSTFARGGGAEGGTPILEDGMVYTPIAYSPQQAQYIESRKLSREEVAAAYYIPPPLIGILDHATYSNIKEQHAHLYQDTLGSWLAMLEQEFRAQIIADTPDSDDVYCEFNIAAKMAGDFESQAAAASTATGGPWMTRNEQRARMNLPWIEGGDELITPLNVTAGGLASPRDTAPKAAGPDGAKAGRPGGLAGFEAERDMLTSRLSAWSARQMDGLLRQVGVKDLAPPELLELWAAGAPDRLAQLQALLVARTERLALVGAWEVLAEHNAEAEGWSADVMLPWLLAAAASHAEEHEAAAVTALREAVADPAKDWREQVGRAAEVWAGATAARRALTAATESRSFGGHDAAGASGLNYKVWRTGSSPRSTHARLDGDRVLLGNVFGNGLRWPGDASGKAAETAGCNCRLDYEREG
ncbi:phage portal protein [Kitasatospora sp. NPDC057692]|uniref:phage portal protein n=1 Tax=Kitasatospora sp. NPDC057692 TaxID=3346215 RepID=UPI00368C89C5